MIDYTVTITIGGTPRTFANEDAVRQHVFELEQAVDGANTEHARRVFALGEMIVAVSHATRRSTTAVIRACCTNSQRGKRAVRWYTALKNSDGQFDLDLFKQRAHETLEHDPAATTDAEGVPSVTAIERTLGHRPPAANNRACSENDWTPRGPDPRLGIVSGDGDDDDEDIAPEHLAPFMRDRAPSKGRAAQAISISANPGASGSQLVLDFDLVRDVDELHNGVLELVAMIEAGDIDSAVGAGLHERLMAAKRFARDAMNEQRTREARA